MYWKYMSEQVGLCVLYNSIWCSIQHMRKTEASRQRHCRIIDDGKQNETVVCAERCHWKPAALRAAAPLCGKRKCISNSGQFLSSRLQLANLQAAWIMHRHWAMSRRPRCFLPQWTDIPHWRRAAGRSNAWRLNNAGGGPKEKKKKKKNNFCAVNPLLLCCPPFPSAANRSPTCLINESPLEARGASAAPSEWRLWMSCAALCFQLPRLRSWCFLTTELAAGWL